MAWQCPYTPLELLEFNPHGFDYGARVILPDGRAGMVSKAGYNYAHVDAGADWHGKFVELRPYAPADAGVARVQQLSLFDSVRL
jgi:hypothetical protein